MYLVSLYFNEEAALKIQRLINKVADKSGNKYMIQGKVPPHITIAAFHSRDEDKVIEVLDHRIKAMKRGRIDWVSLGVFKSSVIFLMPILNEYLHNMSLSIYEGISSLENIDISKYYLPFQWMPHTTIGKKLNKEELYLAFQELDKEFSIFNGIVTRISLSKTKPYEDIAVWNLDS